MLNRWYEPPISIPLDPTVPLCMAANEGTFTAGTVYYIKQKVNAGTVLTGCQFYVYAYTSDAVIEAGAYTYSASGAVTKLTSGSVTATGTGEWTITFSTPIVLTKDIDITAAFLIISGGVTILSRSSAPSISALGWKGATSQSSLPASDNTSRSSVNTWFGLQWKVQ